MACAGTTLPTEAAQHNKAGDSEQQAERLVLQGVEAAARVFAAMLLLALLTGGKLQAAYLQNEGNCTHLQVG